MSCSQFMDVKRQLNKNNKHFFILVRTFVIRYNVDPMFLLENMQLCLCLNHLCVVHNFKSKIYVVREANSSWCHVRYGKRKAP